MAGTLYLVPTPIGNLGDISQRMADTLEAVDFIAAEDTRVTLKLLNHLGLKKPLLSYYRHNTEAGGQAVLNRLLAGENCALVTDAGTPAISDPGEDLVALCAQNGVDVVSIPGPCALITALAVSGLPTGRFTFEGFLAMNKKNRRLTKLHEEVRRTTLGEAVTWYAENPPRGEFVLVVEGAPETDQEELTMEDGLARVAALRAGGSSLRDAVKQTAKETGLPKNELYALALEQD